MSNLKGSQHLKIQLAEIEVATENFRTCIGKGGYGLVYKGELFISGKLTSVAIKRLNQYFGQGSKEFLTEIQLLSGQKHPNLVSLLGFCDEGKEKIIVYEYAERGSLDKYLRRNANTYTLTWLERLKICVDAARGLEHLHSHVGEHLTIIHRDVKSANILIDENWVGKLSDLGLSKLSFAGLVGRSAVITHACGTPGYCEPEYIITGIVKKESDVYSFGMVLFEVLCGRLCNVRDDDGFLLSAPLVKKYYEMNKVDEIVDPSLLEHMSSSSMSKFSEIAYRCLHDIREERPPMYLVREDIQELLDIQVEYEFGKGFGSWPYADLFALRYVGINYDESNMFPWINNYGRKCLLLSAKRCVDSKQEKHLTWVFQPDLRFAMVAEFASWEFIHIHCEINAMMLSFGTIYTASLVFKLIEKPNADLKRFKLITVKWKTEELSVCSTHTAELTSDNWYAIKMWNFTHHGLIKDFRIVIEELSCPEDPYMPRRGLMVQGIQFQPAEMMEHEELEELNISSISNEDAYWEKNIRHSFQQYYKVSDNSMSYTKERFHSHISAGFLGYNGKLWFSLCQSTGGICSMMPVVNILRDNLLKYPTLAFSESRFGEVKKFESKKWHIFTCRLWAPVFSPNNLYAIYLVFKFADKHVLLDDVRVWKIWYALDDIPQGVVIAHLNFPPPMNIPTIRSDRENELSELSNIPKAEEVGIPKGSKEYVEQNWMKQRTDGWMEVMLCKKLHRLEHHYTLKVEMYSKIGPLHEIIVEGVEFRPVKKCI